MADNVNIIVQDTINDIVVNAAVVVETIDINVQAAVDVVDIVANPNNYVVNINRIIGEQVQSDWTQTDNQAPDYIKNKPTIPAAQVNSDWDATSGVAEILNKPTIPTNTSDLVNDGENGVDPFITAADIPPVTGFVPYTGATQNVDLGEYELKAGQLTLDTSPTGTAAVATTRWNDSIGSSETTLKGGTVVLKNGVDLVARVVNKVTPNATLLRANYTAVRISGAQGQRLAVAYAQANNDNNSADTIGLVCENIATNQEGFIMTVGQFEEINTTGSLQGETWADGDVLYLSPTTAGRLTNIKPTGATGHIVVMGYVEYAHANHGKIYVKIMNGWELDELHNVYITSPANNQGLFYDSADSLWKNETIASALGYTPFQLPTLTSGSVLFSNGTTIAQDNANLFWNNSSIGLCLGGTTLDSNFIFQINGNKGARISGTAAGFGYSLVRGSETSSFTNSASAGVLSSTNTLLFNTAATIRVLVNSSGNVLINTTTDAGYRLDVNGTARVQGTSIFTEDATINGQRIGRGGGNSSTNFVAGSAISNNTGLNGTFLGNLAGGNNTSGSRNTYIGYTAGFNQTTGNNNVFAGEKAGRYIADGATSNTITNDSIFIGQNTKPLANNQTNQIVIGYNTTGLGSNTTVLGNSSTLTTALYGNVLINTTTDVGFKLDVNGTARVSGAFRADNTLLVNGTSINASAIAQFDSGSRGFLPPRMTTTQKNAIATPAAGLVVYDTTLNKLCVRTAAAWETITSV